MPVLKSERRIASASKPNGKSVRSKAKATELQQHDDNNNVDGEDDEPLRLFKHTPLPTAADDELKQPAAHSTEQPTDTLSQHRPSQPHASAKSEDVPSQPAVHFTAADYTKLKSLYKTITTAATSLHQNIRAHLDTLPDETADEAAGGNSLYALKNRLLLQYVVRLVHVIRLRVAGSSIADEASVDEMNEIRVILERIRPIEKRIKYSVDKLLAAPADSSAAAAGAASTDPLNYRPNPLDLLPVTAASPAPTTTRKPPPRPAPSLSPPASPTSPASAPLYQAPHHVPTLLTDGRAPRATQRPSAAKLRALYAEAGDGPEERLVEGGGYGELGEASDGEEERREYEERMMVRLVETRDDKRRKRERERRKGLDNMDEYDELRHFVERRERDDKGGSGTGVEGGRGGGDRSARAGKDFGGTSVDDLFAGVERGEGPRKRAKTGSKKGKSGKGGKARAGKRR